MKKTVETMFKAYSGKELCKITGLSYAEISRLKHSKRKPSIESRRIFFEKLGIPVFDWD